MKTKRIAHLLVGTMLLAAGSFSVQAATATFSDMSSGNGLSSLFDPATTTVNGNILTVGLLNFTASSASGLPVVVDSFQVTITAPTGFYISSLDYAETYSYNANAGFAAITLTANANGSLSLPALAFFSGSSGANVGIGIPTILYGPGVESVSFTVSNSLIAFSTSATAVTIGKELATLTVGLTPVPLPPAIGLLGAALIGLTTIGKRRNRAA